MNLNLAPVLDVFRQPGNFIDEFGRSFSSNSSVAARLGTSYAKAEQKHGVAPHDRVHCSFSGPHHLFRTSSPGTPGARSGPGWG